MRTGSRKVTLWIAVIVAALALLVGPASAQVMIDNFSPETLSWSVVTGGSASFYWAYDPTTWFSVAPSTGSYFLMFQTVGTTEGDCFDAVHKSGS